MKLCVRGITGGFLRGIEIEVVMSVARVCVRACVLPRVCLIALGTRLLLPIRTTVSKPFAHELLSDNADQGTDSLYHVTALCLVFVSGLSLFSSLANINFVLFNVLHGERTT